MLLLIKKYKPKRNFNVFNVYFCKRVPAQSNFLSFGKQLIREIVGVQVKVASNMCFQILLEEGNGYENSA